MLGGEFEDHSKYSGFRMRRPMKKKKNEWSNSWFSLAYRHEAKKKQRTFPLIVLQYRSRNYVAQINSEVTVQSGGGGGGGGGGVYRYRVVLYIRSIMARTSTNFYCVQEKNVT